MSAALITCWSQAATAQIDTAEQAREAFQDFAEFVDESEIARDPRAIKFLARSMKGLKGAHIAFAFLDLAMTLNDIANGVPSDTDLILQSIERLDTKVTRLSVDMQAQFRQASKELVDEFRQQDKRDLFNQIEVRYQTIRAYQRRHNCYIEAEIMRAAHSARGGGRTVTRCRFRPVAPRYSDTADDFFEIGKQLGLICKPLDGSLSVLRTVADRDHGNYSRTTMTLLQIIEVLRKAQHVGVWMVTQETVRKHLLAEAAKSGVHEPSLLSNEDLRLRLNASQLRAVGNASRQAVAAAPRQLDRAWSNCQSAATEVSDYLLSRKVLSANVSAYIKEFFLSTHMIEKNPARYFRETDRLARDMARSLRARYSAHSWVVVLVENLKNRWNGCPGGRSSNTPFTSSTLKIGGKPLVRTSYTVVQENIADTSCGTYTINHEYQVFVHGFAGQLLSPTEAGLARNAAAIAGGQVLAVTTLHNVKGKASVDLVAFDVPSTASVAATAKYGLNRGHYVAGDTALASVNSTRKALLMIAPEFK
ncbi:MAG: hypothetical protein P1U49_15365 [Minwuia sp.]|nr:hypothetical protein [Minwuia sp.]